MATIGKDSNGRRRILFVAPDGKRKTLRLGVCQQKAAEVVRLKVEDLLAAQLAKVPPQEETARWLGSLDAAFYNKVVAVGLAPPREPIPAARSTALAEFLDGYVASRVGAKQFYFVTREEAQKVLDAYPDAQWRLLFALSRYGGLRCPSEHLRLRWGDVDWARSRLTVHSPKTERHPGGESRVIPIFPELRLYLEEVWEQAESGAEYVNYPLPGHERQPADATVLDRQHGRRGGETLPARTDRRALRPGHRRDLQRGTESGTVRSRFGSHDLARRKRRRIGGSA